MMVEQLFLAVLRGCLQFVIVVFPDHTHLLFMIKIQLFCLVAVSYVAVQFHVSYRYGLMSKSVKSSQCCE